MEDSATRCPPASVCDYFHRRRPNQADAAAMVHRRGRPHQAERGRCPPPRFHPPVNDAEHQLRDQLRAFEHVKHA
jgi:hypothetical protein